MGPLASFQRMLERFTWSFREGSRWGLARRMLGAEMHPGCRGGEGQGAEETAGPEKDPSIILFPAGEVPTGPSALAVRRTQGGVGTRCSISWFPSPGPAFPLSGDGRKITAGQRSSPQGIRSLPPRARAHLPALSATRARQGGRDVTGAQPREHHHPLIPAGPGEPNLAGARDPWHLRAGSIGVNPAPSPQSGGA